MENVDETTTAAGSPTAIPNTPTPPEDALVEEVPPPTPPTDGQAGEAEQPLVVPVAAGDEDKDVNDAATAPAEEDPQASPTEEAPVEKATAAAPAPAAAAVPEPQSAVRDPRTPGRKTKGSAAASSTSSSSATRRSHARPSGHDIIVRANSDAGPLTATAPLSTAGGYTTGLHLDGQQLTTGEAYGLFRLKNRVAQSYRGPVHVTEDVQVPCAACAGPLDPIERVPVGGLYFHRRCVHCDVCGMSSLTENYSQIRNTTGAVCSACVGKGHEPGARREIIGAVVRAAGGKSSDAVAAAAAAGGRRPGGPAPAAGLLFARPSRAHQQNALHRPVTSLNSAVLPGATAPSLNVGTVHTTRNTTMKSFALMQRQQYYTQSDSNMIMSQIMIRDGGAAAGARGWGASEALAMRKSSSTAPSDGVPRLQ